MVIVILRTMSVRHAQMTVTVSAKTNVASITNVNAVLVISAIHLPDFANLNLHVRVPNNAKRCMDLAIHVNQHLSVVHRRNVLPAKWLWWSMVSVNACRDVAQLTHVLLDQDVSMEVVCLAISWIVRELKDYSVSLLLDVIARVMSAKALIVTRLMSLWHGSKFLVLLV